MLISRHAEAIDQETVPMFHNTQSAPFDLVANDRAKHVEAAVGPRAIPRNARSATSLGKQMRPSLRKPMKADNDIRKSRGTVLDGGTNGRA